MSGLKEALSTAALLGGVIIIGLIARFLLFAILNRVAKRSENPLLRSLWLRYRAPSTLLFPILALSIALPLAKISPSVVEFARQVLGIGMTIAISWMVMKSAFMVEDVVVERFAVDEKDNLQARKIRTQLQVFKKVIIFIVAVFALALVLMSFEKVRQLGTTILASAGVIGIIVGFAAQKTIATLLAGIQVAITQPFRIDDVLIVENEWGRVEEITLTYVVVRIWDLRRLVLPMSYFLEKPFQNWTRTSADLLGTVFLYVDYTVPVEDVRNELRRILDATALWDQKVWNLQVTGVGEKTVELRALMSARDASAMWDLRCHVRERLLEYVRTALPGGLPKVRGELVRREKGGDR